MRKNIKKQFKNGIYQAYNYVQDQEDKAYAILQQKDGYLFIPWYAVFEKQRGKGIGSAYLKELQKREQNPKGILVEVENEKNAKNKKEKEIIQKRKRFYEKIGFKAIEGIDYMLNKGHYDVMLLGDLIKTPKEIKDIMTNMYEEVLQDKSKLEIQIKE